MHVEPSAFASTAEQLWVTCITIRTEGQFLPPLPTTSHSHYASAPTSGYVTCALLAWRTCPPVFKANLSVAIASSPAWLQMPLAAACYQRECRADLRQLMLNHANAWKPIHAQLLRVTDLRCELMLSRANVWIPIHAELLSRAKAISTRQQQQTTLANWVAGIARRRTLHFRRFVEQVLLFPSPKTSAPPTVSQARQVVIALIRMLGGLSALHVTSSDTNAGSVTQLHGKVAVIVYLGWHTAVCQYTVNDCKLLE